MLNQHHKNLLRGLIYPIQFESNPLNGIDRVLRQIVQARALDATPREYSASMKTALASKEKLAALIPQNHSEETVRAYLAALEKRVAASLRMPPATARSSARTRRRTARRPARVPRPQPEVAH